MFRLRLERRHAIPVDEPIAAVTAPGFRTTDESAVLPPAPGSSTGRRTPAQPGFVDSLPATEVAARFVELVEPCELTGIERTVEIFAEQSVLLLRRE
jgi:hypothetical protein